MQQNNIIIAMNQDNVIEHIFTLPFRIMFNYYPRLIYDQKYESRHHFETSMHYTIIVSIYVTYVTKRWLKKMSYHVTKTKHHEICGISSRNHAAKQVPGKDNLHW